MRRLGSALGFAAAWMAIATTVSDGAPTPELRPGLVVAELFTSQGCSSCPPADALWGRMGEAPALRARVVPLTFHVDYWDSLGWRDPFSSADWSARQTDYAHAFGKGRIYTPQAVIDGRAECVGSDEDEVLSHIAAAIERPRAKLALRKLEDGSLGVTALAPDGARRPLEVLVAITEREHTTAVGRGENGGRKLHESFIVRRLETAFTLAPAERAAEHALPLRLDPAWSGLHLGVAVFVQDPETREIFGGLAIDL